MKKKPTVIHFPNPKAVLQPDDRHWHNGGDIEIAMYARSLHNAAKSLIASLDLKPNPATAWNACPALLLYRQTLELHLKILIGDGLNFLLSPTDHITLYRTRSLRWLAQIVCQIIKPVHWEAEFISDVETMEPVSCAVHSNKRGRPGKIPEPLRKSKRVEADSQS